MTLWEIFAIVGLICLILEMVLPSMFFLNLAFAGFATAVIALFVSGWVNLTVIFVILSLLFIILLRPILLRNRECKLQETGMEGKYIGKIVKVIESSNTEYLEGQINKYVNNEIPEEEIAYKTVETYKEFSALYKGKKMVMHVFGRNTCYYCNIFKPVYNDLAAENNLDVYYYDSDSFDSTEYNKILNSGVKIPAECASSGEETPLSSGFGTPLTIFTKKGKVIDCISGYTDRSGLISTLKSVKMISE